MQDGRNAFKHFTGKAPRKRRSGRPRFKWEDNIRMELKEIVFNARNWVDSVQDRNYWSPCKCGIGPPVSISHGVSYGIMHTSLQKLKNHLQFYCLKFLIEASVIVCLYELYTENNVSVSLCK